jgi:hypothetical protein
MRQQQPAARRRMDTKASAKKCVGRGFVSWILLLCTLTAPHIVLAVVCPFIDYMPVGKYPVGHDKLWMESADPNQRHMVQWWYPANPVIGAATASHSYGDYMEELLQSRAMPAGNFDPEVHARMQAVGRAAKDRGAPWIRYNHMVAAAMVATRESRPIAGDWPLIWLDGDPSFGDQLASHGFVVVSSPKGYGSAPTPQQRVQAARDAIEASRTKFQLTLRHIGFMGFDEGAPLAARLNGLYPQSIGLAVLGRWTPPDRKRPRKEEYWFDPTEIRGPTLHILGGEAPLEALTVHPLGAPFSAVQRLHLSELDDAHIQFGMPEACAPKYLQGRAVPSLVLLLSQREIRLRLAHFFADAAKIEIEPRPLQLLPVDERRRQPVLMAEAQLPASHVAPPGPTRIGELLASGGIDALLKALPEDSRPLLPASWWESAIAQLYVTGDTAQKSKLIDAWQRSQPESLSAAVHHAFLIQEGGANAGKLWKQARRLVKSDLGLSPERRAELAAVIKSELGKR